MGGNPWFAWWRVDEKAAPPTPTPSKEDPQGFPMETEPLTQVERTDVDAVLSAVLRGAQVRSRKSRYDDFAAMDTSDVTAMLDAVVDAALTFEDVVSGRGFKVEAEDAEVQVLFNEAIARCELGLVAEEVLRDGLKFGDAFAEPVFDKGVLVAVQTYPPQQMFVNRDDKNRLVRGKDDDGFYGAYQQRINEQTVAGWQPWEMLHFRLFPRKKLIYSERGLLDPLREDWRKLQLVDRGLVVARLTRAYQRRVHYVDQTGKTAQEQERSLAQYIRRIAQRPFGQRPQTSDALPTTEVGEDLYVSTGYVTGADGKPYPRLNRVETEAPSVAGLAEMGDIAYLRSKLWVQVPSDVVGIRRNTSGDLDSQDLAYTRLLRRSQTQLETFLRGIFDLVLLASGRIPSQHQYRVVMPAIDIKASWKFADARFRASLTLRNYLEMGAISRRYALKQALNLSDREVDQIWDQIAEETTNPIFIPLAINRNGLPVVAQPTLDDRNGDNKADTLPSTPDIVVVPASGANADSKGTTNNGVSRGTDLGKTLRGNMSGGVG